MSKRFFSRAILTAALAAGLASSAFGQAIGLNFTGGNNAGAPTALLPGDVAGAAYQQANWNNANGASGTLSGLVNQAGVATSASATWHADGTWGSGTGTANGNFK